METVVGYIKRDYSQGVSWFTCLTAKLDSAQMSNYKEKRYIATVQLSGSHNPNGTFFVV
jgi:hypothetical protein